VRFGGTRDEPTAQVAHVGDSRAYLLRGGSLRPVTEDHSLVAGLVPAGDPATKHPQKTPPPRAPGGDEEVEGDTAVLPVEAGDRFLLCSDGLSDMIPETRIGEILAEAPGDPEKPARSLVSAALDAGGADNVTVIVVDVKAETAPHEERSGDTHEMPPVARSGDQAATRAPAQRPSRKVRKPQTEARSRPSRRTKVARRKRRRSRFGSFVRGLAAALGVVGALCPGALWGWGRSV